jgi:hypothetical protein
VAPVVRQACGAGVEVGGVGGGEQEEERSKYHDGYRTAISKNLRKFTNAVTTQM